MAWENVIFILMPYLTKAISFPVQNLIKKKKTQKKHQKKKTKKKKPGVSEDQIPMRILCS